MDQTKILELAKKYKDIINKEINFESIFLFGSYAKGTAREHSDIDIAIIVNSFDSDYMETVKKLWKLGSDIDSRIEPILLIRDQDIPGFYNEIVRTGILIN